MKIVKVEVKGDLITALCLTYVQASVWFEVEPLPDGLWEVRAKNEEGANQAIESLERLFDVDLEAERFMT